MKKFPDIGQTPLGLYPVVDSSDWIKKLLPLGVSTIQLRIKNQSIEHIEEEIIRSIALSEQYQARLFINDYWELAIKHRAYGVHLGQEDLDAADLDQLHQAGLGLGVSTHSFAEIDRALGIQPSYLAFGPIFPTTSKPMAFVPQGIRKLREWAERLDYPLVAIGGITEQDVPEVMESGVSGVAVISAITQAENPIEATKRLLIQVKGSSIPIAPDNISLSLD